MYARRILNGVTAKWDLTVNYYPVWEKIAPRLTSLASSICHPATKRMVGNAWRAGTSKRTNKITPQEIGFHFWHKDQGSTWERKSHLKTTDERIVLQFTHLCLWVTTPLLQRRSVIQRWGVCVMEEAFWPGVYVWCCGAQSRRWPAVKQAVTRSPPDATAFPPAAQFVCDNNSHYCNQQQCTAPT